MDPEEFYWHDRRADETALHIFGNATDAAPQSTMQRMQSRTVLIIFLRVHGVRGWMSLFLMPTISTHGISG